MEPSERTSRPAATDPAAAAENERAATVEAVLFASDAPLSAAKIAEVAELPGQRAVREAVENLNRRYETMGCAFRIESVAGGYRMLTQPQYHDVLSRLLRARSDSKLTKPALETLSIVAYRQPILRADIEAIRGVACGEVLRGLLEKNLVKIVGRAQVLGRPMLYGTTRRFLEIFGLNSLDDLPRVEELRSGAEGPKAKPPVAASSAPPSPPPEQAADAPEDVPPACEADPVADEPQNIPPGDADPATEAQDPPS